jgi:hypothetical protein
MSAYVMRCWIPRLLSACRRTPCILLQMLGVLTPGSSIPVVGLILRLRDSNSGCVPFQRAPGCAWDKSRISNIKPPKRGYQLLCQITTDPHISSVAPAEITLTFAYIFRNYDLELGQGCATSKTLDRFTLQYENPGLPVVFRRRQAK